MKNRFLKVSSLFVAAMIISTAALTGCGSSGKEQKPATTTTTTAAAATQEQEKSETADFAKISWYVRFDDQKDLPVVQEEMNKIIKQQINAEVELKRIDGGSYNDKLRLTISSGEYFDIAFTGQSFADFYGNVAKGAFLPLDELMKKYAPKTLAQVPADFWKAVTVKGNLYGVINYQIVGRALGFVAQKQFADKYGFDLKSAAKLEDIEPLLEKIKAGEPKDIIPFISFIDAAYIIDAFPEMGIDEIGARYTPGVVAVGDAELKVINQYEMKSLQDRIRLLRKWYLAGYVNKDAATLKNPNELLKAGKVATIYSNSKPGGEAEVKAMFGDNDIVAKQTTKGFVSTAAVAATLQAISKTSKNPERATMLLELINTDKQLYNIMCFGIEDKHYKKISENRVELIPNSGYFPNKAWSFGNQFNAYLYGNQPDDVWEQTKKMNEESEKSLLLGFVFDQEPVKTEIAQCSSVVNEYFPGLYTGTLDPDKYIPEFLNKLKSAGADIVIAEKQKQIDEWKKTR